MDTLFFLYMVPLAATLASVPMSRPQKPPADGWSVKIGLGTGINAATPLRIRQDGQPDISLKAAHYHEKSFQEAPLYHYRFSKWKNDKAWEFELLHHKMILKDKHPDIDYFNVSHGYNYVWLSRAWRRADGWEWRVGAGPVITHPETKIRGREKNDTGGFVRVPGVIQGFFLSGAGAELGAGKRFYLSPRVYSELEAKFAFGWARIPVSGGNADVPNAVWMVTWGIGFDL